MKNKDKTSNKGKVKTDVIILGIITFVVLLLVNSAEWVKSAWENVDFSMIMFQMHTPLAGTNSEVIYSYIDSCIPKAIIGTLAVVSIYWLLRVLCQNIEFVFTIIFFGIKARVKIGKWLSRIYFAGLAVGYCIVCYINAKDIGVFDYLYNISNKSTIFEEQYIDPRSIALEFPQDKRNLILIYLESMETTYASVSAGGANRKTIFRT